MENGSIYVVRVGLFVKIGYTRNLTKRLRGLRFGGAFPPDGMGGSLTPLLSKPATIKEEFALHRILSRYRAYGTNEWYEEQVLESPEIAAANFVAIPAEVVQAPPLNGDGGHWPCPHCQAMLSVQQIQSLHKSYASRQRKVKKGGKRTVCIPT